MVIITCPVEPAVEVVYQEFPKIAVAEPGLSTLFLLISFIVLLGAVVLSMMYLKSMRK